MDMFVKQISDGNVSTDVEASVSIQTPSQTSNIKKVQNFPPLSLSNYRFYMYISIIILFIGCKNEKQEVFYYNYFFANAEKDNGVVIKDFDSSKYRYYFNEVGKKIEFNWSTQNLNDTIRIQVPSKFEEKESEEGYRLFSLNQEKIVTSIQNYSSVNTKITFSGILKYGLENGIDMKIHSAKYFENANNNFVVYEIEMNSEPNSNSRTLGFLFSLGENRFIDISYTGDKEISNFHRSFFIDMFMSLRANSKNVLPADFSIYKMVNLEID